MYTHPATTPFAMGERVPFARAAGEGYAEVATSLGPNDVTLPEAHVITQDVPNVMAHVMVEIPSLYTGACTRRQGGGPQHNSSIMDSESLHRCVHPQTEREPSKQLTFQHAHADEERQNFCSPRVIGKTICFVFFCPIATLLILLKACVQNL